MADAGANDHCGNATYGAQTAPKPLCDGGDILSFTRHARRRSARRNVAPDAVEYVLAYGRPVQRTGVTFFFLGRRDIPACDRSAGWAARLEGTIVVVASDGMIITVYRNRRGSRPLARKLKYRLESRRAQAAAYSAPLALASATA